jgi:drug/metabolite transporter (DMT)-like permease
VSLSVQIGVAFALATAFASIVGFLYKHRGAVESPPIEWRRPVRSSLTLFESRWYVLGILIALGSWGFHVTALALAPISLVQSVIAGGLTLLTVVADRLFGFRVTRREWIGVALTATGLAFLAATMEGTASSRHSDYETTALALYAAAVLAVGIAAALLDKRLAPGIAFAASAGLIWGASDVSIKALSNNVGDGFVGLMTHPLAPVIALLSAVGLTVSAKSLQDGQAVPVIAVTSTAANVVTIASGPIVFGEPLPHNAFGVALRVVAFALVIGAAALTPPPIRDEGEPVPHRVAPEAA